MDGGGAFASLYRAQAWLPEEAGARAMIRAHLRRYGALGRRLNVEEVRLACAFGRRLAAGPFSSL